MNKKIADERQYISKEQLKEMEKTLIRQDHISRYAWIRRFCYGKALDLACGCGYGSFLIAGNPDVESVLGVDVDDESVAWAEKEFSGAKLKFMATTADKIGEKFDTLVCMETIEHIEDVRTIPELVERCKIDNVIVSFPNKKTLHYNSFHKHDFVRQDIIDMFKEHILYHAIEFRDSTALLFVRHSKKAPHDLFRNIRDL